MAIRFARQLKYRAAILPAVHEAILFAGVFAVPVLIDGVRHICQPGTVFTEFQNLRRTEELNAVRWRVAQRLKQPRCDKRRNIVRLAAQHPAGLFRRKPSGELPQKRQKPMLILFHETPVAARAPKRTEIFGVNTPE
jgi:hypothetical protein